MISHLRRTKIIATFGPSITQKLWTFEVFNDPKNADMVKKAYEITKGCFLAGVNVVRLNFSHGSYEEQLLRLKIAREVASELMRPISFMLDTKGPEIRVSDIGNLEGREYKAGSRVTIYTLNHVIGSANAFSVTDSTGQYNMAKDVKVDDIILVDDGKMSMQAIAVDEDQGEIKTIVINSHLLKTNKRINLPSSDYSIPFLSEKDYWDILFAIENKFNYIAASFVNEKANVVAIKDILRKNDAEHIKVIAKIETKQGIDNLDAILSVSDGIMIARGDLGLEVPYYEVPYWGKYIIKKCRYANIPVIMATQMLDSLEKNIIPTRAESSDVFWAVELGVDATMLSGESAQGQFPINAIDVMSRIGRQSEIFFDYKRSLNTYFTRTPNHDTSEGKLIEQIANTVMPRRQVINEDFEYQAIAVFSNDQNFLKILSGARPAARVLLFTSDVNIYAGTGILYAITPILVSDLKHAQDNVNDYLKHYYDRHVQTAKNFNLSRKTLVVGQDKIYEVDTSSPINNVTVTFLHKNF